MENHPTWIKALLMVALVLSLALPTKTQAQKEDLPRVTALAKFDLKAHRVTGKVTILVPASKKVRIVADSLVRIKGPKGKEGHFGPYAKPKRVTFKFSATFQNPATGSYIGPEGIVLPSSWFPQPEGLALYRLTATLPSRLTVVSSMDRVFQKKEGAKTTYTFYFPHPCKTIPLIAAPYHLSMAQAQGITLAVYLLEKDEDLAQRYLLAMAQYVKEYNDLVGPYPYRRLAVVANPIMETGYAFPTFTLLGRHVIRLPFILHTSLPHEILHNWFGNGVYVKGSNWCEGLVSYLADQRMAEKKGEGWRYRHRTLVNYQAYVTPDKDFPLIQFRGKYDPASQAIGYGKGAMVFHMLRKKLGDETFSQAIRELYKDYLFKEAGWQEIGTLMEETSGQDLSSFFQAWLYKRGVPWLQVRVRTAKAEKKGNYLVYITMEERGPQFLLQVPVIIETAKGKKKVTLDMEKKQVKVKAEVEGKPQKLLIDPDYDVMRRLTLPEYPPLVARVLGSGGLMVGGNSQVYTPLKAFLRQKGYREVESSLIPLENTSQNIIYLGELPTNLPHLFHRPPKGADLYMEVQENPYHQEATVTWITSASLRETQRFLPKLPHLGAYQTLATSQGRLSTMEKPHFLRGISISIQDQAVGVNLKALLSLAQVARAVSPSRVIFLGEEHPEYGHHLAQLDIIRWLVEHGHQVAIGMEMFQKPFQKVIDQYLEGKLDLAQFLKETEYFSRWGFNYKLYKPIVDFAKEHKLPIVALNISREITQKVAKEGLNTLTPEEKKEIPQHLDFSNESYRQYLKRVYEAHGNSQKDIKDFEAFYQSQILWDEGMAQSIVDYLSRHPDRQMVVIVGKGHVAYGYGVPSRVERRGIQPCSIVILGNDQELDPNMGDYLVVPPSSEPPFSAKLGVIIKEDKDGLLIKMVLPHTPAQRGGLRKGDLIIRADRQRVKKVEDLRAILYQKNPGDTVKVTIKRGKRTKTLTIGPFRTKEEKQKPYHHPKAETESKKNP